MSENYLNKNFSITTYIYRTVLFTFGDQFTMYFFLIVLVYIRVWMN